LGDPEPAFAPKSRTPSDGENDDEEEIEDDEDWDDEEEQEDEEDDDAPKFHPLDFIGQATGFPTQGFDPPVITDDDLMGQITGFPTPGWGVHRRMMQTPRQQNSCFRVLNTNPQPALNSQQSTPFVSD
jgi:hypothetical protein